MLLLGVHIRRVVLAVGSEFLLLKAGPQNANM